MLPLMLNPQAFVRLSGSAAEINDLLGPLADLQGSWASAQGWNLITVPAPGSNPRGQGDFQILTNKYAEILTFVPVGAPVRNRGGDKDQFIGGLQYEQRIFDANTGQALHVETGLFLNLSRIVTNTPENPAGSGQPLPQPQFPIARLGTIPHGNSVLVLGTVSEENGPPTIPPLSVVPQNVGPKAPLGYADAFLNPTTDIPAYRPTQTLQAAIAGQEISRTVTFVLDTANQGGILNIPFITSAATSTAMQAIFWVETVHSKDSTVPIQQLQYSQVIDIAFDQSFGGEGLIVWPHVTTNTLLKQ